MLTIFASNSVSCFFTISGIYTESNRVWKTTWFSCFGDWGCSVCDTAQESTNSKMNIE